MAFALSAPVLSFPVLSSPVLASPVLASPGAGEVCATETYVWSGRARIAERTSSVDTGVSVPTVSGTRLDVVGTSVDGIDAAGFARAMPITVGGVTAVAGRTVPGGVIVVAADGGTPVEVAGATVVVRRCSSVASASPATASASASASASAAASSASASAVQVLPRTGWADDLRQFLIGSVLVGVGVAMMGVGRRSARLVR